eukprot:gene49820-67646_t
MYLFDVTRLTVLSCISDASAISRRIKGLRCDTPWRKKPSWRRTISLATFRMVWARCWRDFTSQVAVASFSARKARSSLLARDQGVTVFRQFWCHETGKSLKQLGVKPNAITATAVFYHVPDLHDFVAGLEEVMGPDTVFVVQGLARLTEFLIAGHQAGDINLLVIDDAQNLS